jgi:hypothetical protein
MTTATASSFSNSFLVLPIRNGCLISWVGLGGVLHTVTASRFSFNFQASEPST